MKINREKFLSALQMVRAGLSSRDEVSQSSCFAFKNGRVFTFNDEVACRMKTEEMPYGSVQADSLLAILDKIDDPYLQVRENQNGELEFRTKRKRFWLTRQAEILLPIDRVERPSEWKKLPDGFAANVKMLQHCVSDVETQFYLTCVHLHPRYPLDDFSRDRCWRVWDCSRYPARNPGRYWARGKARCHH